MRSKHYLTTAVFPQQQKQTSTTFGPQQPMEKWKVLHPQHMGEITPKNEGNVGFPW